MIKLMIVGRRRPGMTLAEMHTHMLEVHGVMVLRYMAAEPETAPRRYAQNHVFDATFRARSQPDASDPFSNPSDFVTQVWFEDAARAAASVQTPFYLERLRPDEGRFVDQASVVRIPVVEREMDVGSGAAARVGAFLKVFVFLERAAGVSPFEFRDVCAAQPNSLRIDEAGLVRHVRNVVLPGPDAATRTDLVDEFWLAGDFDPRGAATRLRAAVELALSPWIETSGTRLLLAREVLAT